MSGQKPLHALLARSIPWAWSLLRLLVIALLAWLVVRLNHLAWQLADDNWGVGDWLINYAGGFIRRGLAGEALGLWQGVSGTSLVASVIHIKTLLFTAIACYLAWRVWRLPRYQWVDVLLIMAPPAFLFSVIDPQGGGRKELAFLAGWIALIVLRKGLGRLAWPPSQVSGCLAVAYLLVCGTVVLVHEGMAFFLPFVMLHLLGMHQWAWRSPRFLTEAMGLVLGGGVALALSVWASGRPDQSEAICLSVVMQGLPADMCTGAILAVGGKPSFDYDATVYRTIYTQLALFAWVPLLLRMAWVPTGHRSWGLLAGSLVCLLLTLPLYGMAVDWGRWIHIACMCLLILVLELTPRHGGWGSHAVWKQSVAALCSFAYLFWWKLPHCCVDLIYYYFRHDNYLRQWLQQMGLLT